MKRHASPLGRPSESEAIEATAAAWLAQRDDELSPEGEREFAQWRAADPRHEAAVARLEGAWSALQQLRDFRPEAARHPDSDLLRGQIANRRRRIVFPAFATAALAASIAVAAFWWSGNSRREIPAAPQQISGLRCGTSSSFGIACRSLLGAAAMPWAWIRWHGSS